jgi:hypothetical protein
MFLPCQPTETTPEQRALPCLQHVYSLTQSLNHSITHSLSNYILTPTTPTRSLAHALTPSHTHTGLAFPLSLPPDRRSLPAPSCALMYHVLYQPALPRFLRAGFASSLPQTSSEGGFKKRMGHCSGPPAQPSPAYSRAASTEHQPPCPRGRVGGSQW